VASTIQYDVSFAAPYMAGTGSTDGDLTVQTCWDADRLDLGRVGICPQSERLCTAAAKQLIKWADGRACFEVVPELVSREWGIDTTEQDK
jgi:uncharacterized protein